MTEAADLLGYPWFVTGEVVHGDRRGRELGYPTANLRLDPGCGLRHGIYAVRVAVDGKRYDGVANFGRRPMFDTGIVLLEVFLFDFSGDLYGRTIDVAFIDWIRPEMMFDSRRRPRCAAWTTTAASPATPCGGRATCFRRLIPRFCESISDLILRSLAQQGVSKDGPKCCGLWPSFETPAKAGS